MSVNRVNIVGNLTRDPDLRATAGGTFVMSLGVAVNDRHKNQQTGEWEDYPNFIDCTMFGNRAQSVSRFLSKGSKVAVEGHLRWSTWMTDQGEKRSKLEVIVDEIEFMSAKQGGSAGNMPAADGVYHQQPVAAPMAAPVAQAAVAAPVAQMPMAQAPMPQAPMQAQMPGMPAPVVDASIYDSDIPF